MYELLEELVGVPGIPGSEDRVREFIAGRLPSGLRTATDTMGNLVATLGSGDPSLLFVAHMDEIGFVVSEVREDGFLKLKPLGGTDPRTVFGRLLRIVTGEGELPGVVGVLPPHLMRNRSKEMGEVPAVTDLVVDIGASSRAEAEGMGVRVLDFAVLEKSFAVLNDSLLCARGLDDRLGCFILIRALERLKATPLEGSVHFAFSVQEEVGLRGAKLLARTYPAKRVFAVDTASSADFPNAPSDATNTALGRGPCLRVFDNAAIIPRAFTEEVRAIAEAAEIPLQIVFSGGGTDVGPFQAEGPQVMPLGFPLRYTHSAVEMAHKDDVAHMLELVCAIVGHFAGS
jgi:putative aminopeptidase FrvX